MLANGASKCEVDVCQKIMTKLKDQIDREEFESQHLAMLANGASKCEADIRQEIMIKKGK